MKRCYFVVVFWVVSFGMLFAKETKESEVVARVNDREIKFQEVFKRLYNVNGAAVLNQMVQEILIEEESRKQKVEIPDKEIQEKIDELKKQFKSEADFTERLKTSNMSLEDLKKDYKNQLLIEKLVIKIKNLAVTDEEVKTFFETNKEKLAVPEQFHVQQILVQSEQEANDLLIALSAGADFSVMAKAKSIDSASRDKGGDIGFFSKGMLLPEFENAVFKLEMGKTSPVVQTKIGYHIIKLIEKKPAQEAKFDKDMKIKLNRMILLSKINNELPGIINELAGKAKIEVLYK